MVCVFGVFWGWALLFARELLQDSSGRSDRKRRNRSSGTTTNKDTPGAGGVSTLRQAHLSCATRTNNPFRLQRICIGASRCATIVRSDAYREMFLLIQDRPTKVRRGTPPPTSPLVTKPSTSSLTPMRVRYSARQTVTAWPPALRYCAVHL